MTTTTKNDDKEFLHSLHPLLPDEMTVRQSSNFRMEKIPCCTLLKDNDDETHVLKLNDSGALIWQLCFEERSVGEIVELLADAFELERQEIARDVSRVISYLMEENAVLQGG